MSLQLSFCGAAGTVTGSCYLMQHRRGRFLIDCGLFQGTKTVKQLNYGRFPFDPAKIDFVLLTHAHIDHAGLLPKLEREGFEGPIYATRATADLLRFMLPDSGYIQESEVERLNRRNARRGRPRVEPIYTRADAEAVLEKLRPVDYDVWLEPMTGVQARFWNAGHILGAASIELELESAAADPRLLRLLFSGDIGPEHKLFHPDPTAPENLDYVVCEATYGDRGRQRVDGEQRRNRLRSEVAGALKRGGNLLIPSFAVERTQELLADLCLLCEQGRLPRVPIFLDSPLAVRATEVFRSHRADLEDLRRGGDPFRLPNVRFTETVEQSKAIARITGGAVILAASGMCDAGRIRHHLKQNLWRDDCTVLLTGYQAIGTLGRLLQEGARGVRIHGEEIAVRASIRQIDLYSGHADAEELADWVVQRLPVKRALFLTHGEDEARRGLRARLVAAGVDEASIFLPQLDDTVALSGPGAPRLKRVKHRLTAEEVDRPDWHNDYARFVLDLRAALDAKSGRKARAALLRRLRRALEG